MAHIVSEHTWTFRIKGGQVLTGLFRDHWARFVQDCEYNSEVPSLECTMIGLQVWYEQFYDDEFERYDVTRHRLGGPAVLYLAEDNKSKFFIHGEEIKPEKYWSHPAVVDWLFDREMERILSSSENSTQ